MLMRGLLLALALLLLPACFSVQEYERGAVNVDCRQDGYRTVGLGCEGYILTAGAPVEVFRCDCSGDGVAYGDHAP